MKTVLALTMAILIIVFCNCGNTSLNSGNNSPQVETGRKIAEVTSHPTDTLMAVR